MGWLVFFVLLIVGGVGGFVLLYWMATGIWPWDYHDPDCDEDP